MLLSRGDPTNHTAGHEPVKLAQGAIVDLPDFLADRLITEGAAEEFDYRNTSKCSPKI